MDQQSIRLLVYILSFALAPAILIVGFIEPKYHILSEPDSELIILFVLLYLIFFGIVLFAWRLANRPKD